LKKIQLNNKGELIAKDIAFFGGKYTFMERFRMSGIGSPKVVYKQGVPYFDELASIENEVSFANFELMKNGFLIRIHRNLQLRYIGYQLHEILKIEFNNKVEKNRLLIKTLDEVIIFKVPLQSIGNIKTFFDKKIFAGKYELD